MANRGMRERGSTAGTQNSASDWLSGSHSHHIRDLLDPQVGEQVTASSYIDILRNSSRADRQAPAVYVHLPFCPSRCLSSDYTATVTHDPRVIDQYLDMLAIEFDLVCDCLDEPVSLSQLYVGGGTPNYLSDPQLLRLADMLDEHFTVDGDSDTVVEISARRSSASQLQLLRGLGFRTLKLEARDVDSGVQQALGRADSLLVLEDVFTNARDAAFDTISVDLVYGLPGQSPESLKTMVDGLIALAPDRITCHPYARQSEQFRQRTGIQSSAAPSLADRLIMFNRIVDAMDDAGYTWVGLDSFAVEGDPLVVAQEEQRLAHNWMGYNSHGSRTLLGFGASGISEFADACVQNHDTIDTWSESLEKGDLPIRAGVQLSERGMQHRHAVNGLLSNLQINGEFEPGAGEASARALETLCDQGCLRVDDEGAAITLEGRYLLHHFAGNAALDLKWCSGW